MKIRKALEVEDIMERLERALGLQKRCLLMILVV